MNDSTTTHEARVRRVYMETAWTRELAEEIVTEAENAQGFDPDELLDLSAALNLSPSAIVAMVDA